MRSARRKLRQAASQRFPCFRREEPPTVACRRHTPVCRARLLGVHLTAGRNAPADALTLVALSSLIRAPSRGRARTRTGTMQRLRNAWNAAALRMRGAYLTRNRRTAGSVMSLDNDLTIVCGDLAETCAPPLCFSLAHSGCLLSFSLYRDHPGS